MKVAITILILLVAASAAIAEQPVGRVSLAKQVKTMGLYEPEPASAGWFNQHNMVVYSRGRHGEQVDIVRKGNFFRELYIGSDGKLHVIRCGNPVWMIEVEREICLVGQAGPRGPQGPPGPPGPAPAQNVNVYNYNYNYTFGSSAVGSYQIGGNQPAIVASVGIGSIGYVPPSNISLTLTATANPVVTANPTATGGAGGAGGSVGDIINNNSNANTNINPNNNVINVGSGSASGVATGTGDSAASAGN